MKRTFYKTIFLLSVSLSLLAQNRPEEYFIPLELSYYSSYKYRIPINSLDEDIWISMLSYPSTNPNQAAKLQQSNKALYDQLSQKVLFRRKSCDSLIHDYVVRVSKIDNWSTYGKEGTYKTNEKNPKNDDYMRCVCIPATELINVPHKQKIKMGNVYKYFNPKEFCAKFRRYGLDTLNLQEAAYYTIFPLDINPSFDCSKASSSVEKAICRSVELSKLDRELFKKYKLTLKTKGEEVREDQKKWIAIRDSRCEGKTNEEITSLLADLYKRRINELDK